MLPAICATCGADFMVDTWRVRKFANVYCSRACSAASHIRRVTSPCAWCGAVVTYKPSKKIGAHVFCSTGCADRHREAKPERKIQVACAQCEATMMVYPSKAAKNKRFYCSTTCRALHIAGANNPAYTGGLGRKRKYGQNWRRQRRAAMTRDNFCCQHCHKRPRIKRNLHVHHIQPFYTFNGDWQAANELSNLITLCLHCHKQAEHGAIVLQPWLF